MTCKITVKTTKVKTDLHYFQAKININNPTADTQLGSY